ncbi:MAG: CDP-alcohol phosphatidyltransferase family protein [Bacteroidaceae bacterium]|nr:CDP-alcohol phosphatidyltransferase family protein [Bacteroidaceae bacterium]
MGNEKAVRIQTSVLNATEKKLLVAIANRMPRKVTSDTLTFIGVLGAVVCFIGFLLSNISLQFLWLVIIGLFVNWYGDSLDGTVARVRNTQRPIYGYYLDHNVDVLNEALLFIGAGLSPLVSLPVALFALTGYFALTIYTCICQIVKNEFRLTYLGLGPTEFRLIIQILLLCFMYIPGLNDIHKQFPVNFGDEVFSFSIFDFIIMGIAVLLYVMYAISFHRDRKKLAIIDPLPESES